MVANDKIHDLGLSAEQKCISALLWFMCFLIENDL